MPSTFSNWIDSICWQIEFSTSLGPKRRSDPEFDWHWFEAYSRPSLVERARQLIRDAIMRSPIRSARWRQPTEFSQEWVRAHSEALWSARILLEDDLSKVLFDAHLVLRAATYHRVYYPRIDFDDVVDVLDERPFKAPDLPHDYLGLPLREFELRVNSISQTIRMVSTVAQIRLLNSYRQYLVRRPGIDMSPRPGDIVFDCGACIGEISMLFAGLVGLEGRVHLFDPIPLHARYCQYQESLNPFFVGVFKINILAVGDVTRSMNGTVADSAKIAPGGLAIDTFNVTTLDDYVESEGVDRLDFVKMDIEGSEMAALVGGSETISRFKPRLAISAYHKPSDLWEIPHLLKSLNRDYKLFFGHHSPIQWESVYYAWRSEPV